MNGKAAVLTLVLIYLHRRHVALLVAEVSIDRVLSVLCVLSGELFSSYASSLEFVRLIQLILRLLRVKVATGTTANEGRTFE
jgi:hypothetical protein